MAKESLRRDMFCALASVIAVATEFERQTCSARQSLASALARVTHWKAMAEHLQAKCKRQRAELARIHKALAALHESEKGAA